MAWIDGLTIIAAVAPMPFVNLGPLAIFLILIGLPLGARAGISNEPSRKKSFLIISGTLVLLLGCIYLVMFIWLNKYGS
jgi:hypothetical protein